MVLAMPVLTRVYGFKPWEIADLSPIEIESYFDALEG